MSSNQKSKQTKLRILEAQTQNLINSLEEAGLSDASIMTPILDKIERELNRLKDEEVCACGARVIELKYPSVLIRVCGEANGRLMEAVFKPENATRSPMQIREQFMNGHFNEVIDLKAQDAPCTVHGTVQSTVQSTEEESRCTILRSPENCKTCLINKECDLAMRGES